MIYPLALFLVSIAGQTGNLPDSPDTEVLATPRLPPCIFESGATLVERKADLPPDAASELERVFATIGGLADAGDYFQSTDLIVSDAPRARFIRAYHVDDVWFVWFERGGMGLSRQTITLVPRLDEGTGRQVLRVAPGSSFHGDLCAGSKAFIAGARSAG